MRGNHICPFVMCQSSAFECYKLFKRFNWKCKWDETICPFVIRQHLEFESYILYKNLNWKYKWEETVWPFVIYQNSEFKSYTLFKNLNWKHTWVEKETFWWRSNCKGINHILRISPILTLCCII